MNRRETMTEEAWRLFRVFRDARVQDDNPRLDRLMRLASARYERRCRRWGMYA